jgi:hypothetical protein
MHEDGRSLKELSVTQENGLDPIIYMVSLHNLFHLAISNVGHVNFDHSAARDEHAK